MHKPFLVLQSRPEDETSDDEARALCEIGGILPGELVRVRMDKNEYPAIHLADYSGVIVPGGPANLAYDDAHTPPEQKHTEHWLLSLMDEIILLDKPFLGICLGFGLLSLACGVRPNFDDGEPVSASQITLTDAGKQDKLLQDLPETFSAVVGHKEGVAETPKDCRLLARSAACVQMIRRGANAYGVQFHPELDAKGLWIRLQAYRHHGYFDPDNAEAVMDSIDWQAAKPSQAVLRAFVERYRS